MKRESGVNPEQSRCCKLLVSNSYLTKIPAETEVVNKSQSTIPHPGMGRRFNDGVSQKTCHA
jgi:hypothetical protein